MTRVVIFLGRALGIEPVLADLISRILDEEGAEHIVDLGSGGGGIMPGVLTRLRATTATAHCRLTMTDLHPNRVAVKAFNQPSVPEIRYLAEPVDAANFASLPNGLKTMVNSFHHMRPREARAILETARDNSEPILIYEMIENKFPFGLWLVALPVVLPLIAFSAIVLTPFVRPLTLRQLFFTYVIPLIPIFYAWDGHASTARVYSLEDLGELLQGLDSPHYRWEKGLARRKSGKTLGTYLRGAPVRGGDE